MAYLTDLIAHNACCCESYSQPRNWDLCTNTQTTNTYTLGTTLNRTFTNTPALQHNDISSLIECTLTEIQNSITKIQDSITKKIDTETKEEKNEMENKFFNGLFGKLNNGVCRLSMDGEIAVKTSNGYKYYSKKSNRPVNCDQFVFDIGDEFFFVVPTNKTEVGDILLINGQPRYVLETKNNMITVLNYEDCTIESILPESHVFMGDTYFYGKIVSMFGDDVKGNGMGMKKMMRYMMLSEMMKSNSTNGMNSLLPYFLMTGEGFNNLFDGLFSTENEGETNEVNA